jgi:hypothetical protein
MLISKGWTVIAETLRSQRVAVGGQPAARVGSCGNSTPLVNVDLAAKVTTAPRLIRSRDLPVIVGISYGLA